MDFNQYSDEAFADLARQVKAEELRRNRLAVVKVIRDYFDRHPEEDTLVIGINFNASQDGVHFMPSTAFYDGDENMLSDEEYEILDNPAIDWLPAFDFDGETGDYSWYNFTYKRDFKEFTDYEETTSGED